VTASQFDTSKLLELLQQSAVEHFTSFRQLEAQKNGSLPRVKELVTAEFDVLYAYKCGEYDRCLRLAENVRNVCHPIELYMYPEVIQLLDDDLVSLIGLTWIIKPCRESPASVTCPTLLLYLITECRIKLNLPADVDDEYLALSKTIDLHLLKLVIRKLEAYTGHPFSLSPYPNRKRRNANSSH